MHCPGHLILDNGAAEGSLVQPAYLLQKAQELGVHEVVAPDVLGECDETIELVKGFMPFAGGYNIMVVLQAQNWTEFDRILKTALDYNVASVALPKLLAETIGPLARVRAAERVRNISDVPIHALGCTDLLREARWLSEQGIVRGIDSAAPVVHASQNRSVWEQAVKRPDNYFDLDLNDNLMVEVNLAEFRLWCEAPPSSKV